jgi:hypothetical protein
MKVWGNPGWLETGVAMLIVTPVLAISSAQAAIPRTSRLVPLRPLVQTARLVGAHRSNCTPTTLDGRRTYSRLELRFSKGKRDTGRYMSEETVYSDPQCEISVFKTSTSGAWKAELGTVLTLFPSRIRFMPLDPRIADAMDIRRACGKSWQNGEEKDVTRTACGKERIAQYFMSRTRDPHAIDLFECEGKEKPDEGCAKYALRPVLVQPRRASLGYSSGLHPQSLVR